MKQTLLLFFTLFTSLAVHAQNEQNMTATYYNYTVPKGLTAADYKRAIKGYSDVLAKNPKDADAYVNRAKA